MRERDPAALLGYRALTDRAITERAAEQEAIADLTVTRLIVALESLMERAGWVKWNRK